jgi:hypothetical protein
MGTRKPMLLVLLLLSVSPAHAIDPGFATGTLRVAHETITLTHSYAQLHDNAEGLLNRPKEMRILVTDREVRQETLNGLVVLPVTAMAKEGAVRGLLITFDPNERTNVLVTFLYPPANPHTSLVTQTRINAEGVVRNLRISGQRVSGEIEDREQRESGFGDIPPVTYATSFSAPLFHEPGVTEDLKGHAVRNSPQVKVLRAAAEAMRKADFEALRKLSTERASRRTDLMLSQTGGRGSEVAGEAGKELANSVDKVRRVVVRGTRAVVIFPDESWRTLERVDNEWKMDE